MPSSRPASFPPRLELMDQTAIACVEQAMHLGLPTDIEALFLVETDGADEQAVLREIQESARILREHGARSVTIAADEAERKSLWEARRSVSPSLARKAPNKLGEDITVPRSAIPEVVQRLRGISAKHGLPIVIFGHAGDGNLHPNILFDQPPTGAVGEGRSGWSARSSKPHSPWAGHSPASTASGVLKRPYLERALGPLSLEIQRRIKQALDPMNILNPGKILPERAPIRSTMMAERAVRVPVDRLVAFMVDCLIRDGHPTEGRQDHRRHPDYVRPVGHPVAWRGAPEGGRQADRNSLQLRECRGRAGRVRLRGRTR